MATAPSHTLLFENTAGQLLADSAGFLRMRWSASPRTLAATQAYLGHVRDSLRAHGWSRVLTNQTDMPAFSPTEQAWVTQEWLPEAVAAGYRTGAIVVASNIFSRLATSFVTTNVQGLPLRYRSFDDEATAVAWLLQQG